MNTTKRKTCPVCDEILRGRSDKIFCSSDCRTTYHNSQNKDASSFMSSVNNILRKNRRILMKLNQGGKAKVHVKQLMQEGYKFAYHTNEYTTKSGKKYIFCYDQGFLEIESGMLALVVKQDYVV